MVERFSDYKDEKAVISKRGVVTLFRLFRKKYPNISYKMLYDINDHDMFFWSKYEISNPSLRSIVRDMKKTVYDFIKEFYGHRYLKYFFFH